VQLSLHPAPTSRFPRLGEPWAWGLATPREHCAPDEIEWLWSGWRPAHAYKATHGWAAGRPGSDCRTLFTSLVLASGDAPHARVSRRKTPPSFGVVALDGYHAVASRTYSCRLAHVAFCPAGPNTGINAGIDAGVGCPLGLLWPACLSGAHGESEGGVCSPVAATFGPHTTSSRAASRRSIARSSHGTALGALRIRKPSARTIDRNTKPFITSLSRLTFGPYPIQRAA